MLDSPLIWSLAVRFPSWFSAPALHRAGLAAMAVGAFPVADELLERAALRYRSSLEVEALARSRVHQLMARARAQGGRGREGPMGLEVEQRLARLEQIEALAPPFEMVPASRLLASWSLEGRAHDGPEPAEPRASGLHEAA